MHTRSKGLPLEPLDPEIEASNRKRNAYRRLTQKIQASSPNHVGASSSHRDPSAVQFESDSPSLMDNLEDNNDQPRLPTNAELMQQLEELRQQVNRRPVVVPVQNQYAYHGVAHPAVNNNINANTFELKRGLIQMAENIAFRGRSTDDPNKHLTKFIQICNTTKLNGVTDEQIRLRLFPFSLDDSARDWLESLEPRSIRTWDAMVEKFLEKYYPPSEAIKRQHEIIAFQMTPAESIREAWARFKALMKRCPNHELSPTVQVITFFKGCVPEAQRELNLSSGGSLLKKGVTEAMEVIEELASNDEGWSNERSKMHRVASATDHDQMSALSDKLDTLTMKFDCMTMGQPSQELQGGVEDVNYVQQGGNNRYYNNSRPNYQGGGYNQYGNKGHPNLSYGNPNNALQPPPGFTVSGGMINEPKKMTTEDILKSFMTQTNKIMEHNNQRMEKVESDMQGMATHLKNIDTQISQISQAVSANTQPGKFPSTTIINPKDCKAIHLRSGTSYEGPSMPSQNEGRVAEKTAEEEDLVEEEETVQITTPPKENPVTSPSTPPTSHAPAEVRIPYPQRVQKKKTDAQFLRFLDIFRKVQINIPLVEALQQMPSYAKFLKDVVSNKRRWVEYETVNLTENCSAIIQKKLPAKLKDPGSFTISCIVGDSQVGRALCDLGASINLMPYSFFQKLKIGKLRPTTISLQMADRTVSYPKGIVEDILVKVGEFIFPADFVVLDMEEDKHIPLLLGRPFLATGRALIDVQKGELTLRLNDESITFSIYDAMQRHDDEDAWKFKQCNMIEVVDDCVREVSEHIEEQEEEQLESSSRIKRSRPPGSISSDDRLNTLVEGMSTMQLGQTQQASILEQLQQWHQVELEWRVGVDAQLADLRATQEAHGAQLHNMQMQHDTRWTQQQARNAQEEAQEAEQRAFFQAYYLRFPPQG